MIQIIPSLASADQLDLKGAIDSLPKVKQLHMDIEDGNFIPNITFGMRTVRAVAAYSQKDLDVHLMVARPEQYLEDLLALHVKGVCIHAEAVQYPAVALGKIRGGGARAGLAFNLQAPVEIAGIYAEWLDYVLLMTAEPDSEEQRFNPYALSRIAHARSVLPARVQIVVDGGVSSERLPQVIAAGADCVVMGRAIWGAPHPQEAYERLTENANSMVVD